MCVCVHMCVCGNGEEGREYYIPLCIALWWSPSMGGFHKVRISSL